MIKYCVFTHDLENESTINNFIILCPRRQENKLLTIFVML